MRYNCGIVTKKAIFSDFYSAFIKRKLIGIAGCLSYFLESQLVLEEIRNFKTSERNIILKSSGLT